MSIDLSSALQRFPRYALLDGPTPIQRLARLEAALGAAANGVRLYAKRDDHMALGGGGNKLRKLEFLLGEARGQGADTVVTVGGLQSNHARLTAAAAARAGMACELVLGRVVPRADADYEENGNMLLNRLLGATVHALPVGADAMAAALERVRALELAGRRVYLAPLGGSTPVGALGYAACAQEILEQERALGVTFARVVVANGSAGTHAGLAAGMVAAGLPATRVQSFTTLADTEVAQAKTRDLTAATLALLGRADGEHGAATGERRPRRRPTTSWWTAASVVRPTACPRPPCSRPSACWRAAKGCCSTRCIRARPSPACWPTCAPAAMHPAATCCS